MNYERYEIWCIHYNCMLIFLWFLITYFFRMLYDYSYNFIKKGLLSFIFWNYIIYFYILIFPWKNILWSFKIKSYLTFRLFLSCLLLYTHSHTHTHTHTHIYTYTHTYVYIYTHICIDTHIHIYIYILIYIWECMQNTHIYTHIYSHMYICIYTNIYTYIYIYIYTCNSKRCRRCDIIIEGRCYTFKDPERRFKINKDASRNSKKRSLHNRM